VVLHPLADVSGQLVFYRRILNLFQNAFFKRMVKYCLFLIFVVDFRYCLYVFVPVKLSLFEELSFGYSQICEQFVFLCFKQCVDFVDAFILKFAHII